MQEKLQLHIHLQLKKKNRPTVISLSRQDLPQLETSSIKEAQKGGYVIFKEDLNKKLEGVIIGTGSEVSLAIESIKKSKKNFRIVSMPCVEIFEQQSKEYKREIIPKGVPVIAIEAAIMNGWEKYSHFQIGMKSYGASANEKDLAKKFGFNEDNVNEKIEIFLKFYGENQLKELTFEFEF